MDKIKWLGFFILAIALTACGLGSDNLPSEGLTGAVGAAPTRTPQAQADKNAYPQTDVFSFKCQGEKVAGQDFVLVNAELETADSASSFVDDWAQNSATFWLKLADGLTNYEGGVSCEGSGEMSLSATRPDGEAVLVDWLLEQKIQTLTVTLNSGQSRTRNNASLLGIVTKEPLDFAILTQNENITPLTTNVQCQGSRVPDTNLATVTARIAMPDGTEVTSQGLYVMDDTLNEIGDSFNCGGVGQITAVPGQTDALTISLLKIELQDLTVEDGEGQSVVMSGGSTMLTTTAQPVVMSGGSTMVVMSGGSTMLRNYYEGTVATGGLLVVPVEISSCWAVFEPNNANVQVAIEVKPQAGIFTTGDSAPPYFYGGGTSFFDEADALFAESTQATCSGLSELTAFPIHTDEHGRIKWLAVVDLGRAVWKAPAGVDVNDFFSENGYRVLMLMETSEEVPIDDTAVAKAYDLNPNDLNVTEFKCGTTLVASDPDNGEARKRPGRAIMFETLIGEGTLRGGGTMLGGEATASPDGTFQASCAEGITGTVQSAQILIGDGSVRLLEFNFPELTLQAEDGSEQTFTDVTILGLGPDDIKTEW